MTIMIRTDGNSTLGMGHVMRCLSLAKALRALKCECIFAVSDDMCISEIQNNQFMVYNLNAQWNNYDSSLNKFVVLIQSVHPCLVVVDSYFYSDSFLNMIGGQAKLAVITERFPDDFSSEVDYFINYNIFLNNMNPYPVSNKTKYMLGSKYALLRAEFELLPTVNNHSKNNIAILTGGSDPYNIAFGICEEIIKDVRFSEINVNIISGKLNPNIACLLELEKKSTQVSLVISPPSMRDEMLKNEIAVSAGGSTLYELCACAIPSISFSYADNQLNIVKYFDDIMLIPYSGDIRGSRLETIAFIMEGIHRLLNDDLEKNILSLRMRELCDGKGAMRVASIFTSS